MYIYDRKLSGVQSLLKEQPITSPIGQRNSYHPDRVVSGFLGCGESSGSYVWANEGLGKLSNEKSLQPNLSKTDNCPGYEPGEQPASKKHPGVLGMPIAVLKPDTLLVADFGVGWRHVKAATKRDPALLDWLRLAKSDPSATFEVLGYSDCIPPRRTTTSCGSAAPSGSPSWWVHAPPASRKRRAAPTSQATSPGSAAR